MKNVNTKKEIVNELLRAETLDKKDKDELTDLLINKPLSIDIDKEEEEKKTKGDAIADKVSEIAGSWKFILGFSGFLLFWVILNGFILKDHPMDEYPFILLNLLLSCLAALQAPIIMMSQNRQAKKDSLRNQNDYIVDLKTELILEDLSRNIDKLIENQERILERLEKVENEEK